MYIDRNRSLRLEMSSKHLSQDCLPIPAFAVLVSDVLMPIHNASAFAQHCADNDGFDAKGLRSNGPVEAPSCMRTHTQCTLSYSLMGYAPSRHPFHTGMLTA